MSAFQAFASRVFGIAMGCCLSLGYVGLSGLLSVSILIGETYEIGDYSLKQKGDFPLILTSSLGCDSLILLKLSTYNVFIPNIFIPNFDGINDIFRPIALKGEIRFVSMLIYDRWGDIVYNGAEWDGTNTQNAVYAYNILIEFMDGNSKRPYL